MNDSDVGALRADQARRWLVLRRLLRRGLVRIRSIVVRSPHPTPRILGFSSAEVSDRYVELALASVAVTVRVERHVALSRHRWRRLAAPWRRWDLVIVADHVIDVFPDSTKILYLRHGLVRSRALGVAGYDHDPSRALRAGQPRYWRHGETSESEAEHGRVTSPALDAALQVVGDVRTDLMLELALDREHLRARLGFPPGHPVLAVVSTWGPHSLVARHSSWLFPELERLLELQRVSVVATCHANWGDDPMVASRLRRLASRGATVIERGADWELALAVADVALSDHTSLVGPILLSEGRLLFTPVSEGIVAPGTVVADAMRLCERVERATDLMPAIERVLARDPQDLHELRSRCLDARGRARARLSAVVLEALTTRGSVD